MPLVASGFVASCGVMVAANDFASLERMLRPLRREMSLELASALIHLQADDEVQARFETLADKNTSGELSEAEREELESLVRVNSLLGIFKAEARGMLATKPSLD